jgi:ribosomal protein S18 acetylase RimI-like enzyme
MSTPLPNFGREFTPQAQLSLAAPGQSEVFAAVSDHFSSPASNGSTEELKSGQEAEALSFLSERPVHTVIMSGLIRENGLEGRHSRGNFYAHRSANGAIEGMALIGHATLFETRSDHSIKPFARLASGIPGVSLVLGERDKVEKFWHYYSGHSGPPHYRRNELLFEQRWPSSPVRVVPGLRPARLADLSLVVASHARMAEEELGVNPLTTDDADGFQMRCERRIRQGRVWVLIEKGRLIFKADVVAATDAANYIEGVYVNPEERSKGNGTRCLAQVSRNLLSQTQAVCLLVSEQNRVAQGLARKAGFTVISCYETIFLAERARIFFAKTEHFTRV